MKRAMVKVQRNGENGPIIDEVKGWELTENFGAYTAGNGYWNLTHLPTGWRLFNSDFARRKDCQIVAEALEPSIDWSSDDPDDYRDRSDMYKATLDVRNDLMVHLEGYIKTYTSK